MNTNALLLFSSLHKFLTSYHQRENFKALMAMLLEANGHGRAEHVEGKSPAAISRFLNVRSWNIRAMVRTLRQAVTKELAQQHLGKRGRRPLLYALVDLTTLEKSGDFPHLPILVLNNKRGLHLVMLYLVIGEMRFVWGLRVWRGKDTPSPSDLALRLLRSLPVWLTRRFRLRVLADGGFGNDPFIRGVNNLGFEAIVGMRHDRKLADGRTLHDAKQGEELRLENLEVPVWVGRFILKKPDGSREVRYVVANFKAAGRYLALLGRKRWLIEQLFKLAKHRFSLHQFGQRTALGVYRFLVLSLLAYILARWHAIATGRTYIPDWSEVSRELRLILLPDIELRILLARIERLELYLHAYPCSPERRCKL